MKEKVVKHDQINIWTESFGTPNNTAILLIAGSSSPGTYWPIYFCEKLSNAGFHVIRYDHRDTGFSSRLPVTNDTQPAYSFYDLVDDAIAILDGYHIPRAHIVGCSMGGYMVEMMAAYHSTRLLSGTIISAGPTLQKNILKKLKLPERSQETIKFLSQAKFSGKFEEDLSEWIKCFKYMHGDIPIDETELSDYLEELYHKRGLSNNANYMKVEQTIPEKLADDIKKISVPILIMHGEKDNLIPIEHGKKIAELIQHATFVPMPTAGHVFFNKKIWLKIAEILLKHFQ